MEANIIMKNRGIGLEVSSKLFINTVLPTMIKTKFLYGILLVLMGMLFTACSNQEEEKAYKYQVYYLNREETHISPVEYGTDTVETEEVVDELLGQLAIASAKLEYTPVISGSFQLLRYEIIDKQIILHVDERYKEQTVTTEVLVRAALVRTLTQVEGIDFVTMMVRSEPLTDINGTLIGIMTADMFIDNTGDEINTYEKVKLKLYFTNEQGDGLVTVSRNVVYNSNISLERLVVEQLIMGPQGQDNVASFPTINPSTKLISVTVKDGICYVNLDKTFQSHLTSVSANATIYSITNSLAELTNINKVQISINGDTNATYKDVIHLSTVFERNLEMIVQ